MKTLAVPVNIYEMTESFELGMAHSAHNVSMYIIRLRDASKLQTTLTFICELVFFPK